MCNDYAARYTADDLATAFSATRIPLTFPTGVPNLEPRDNVRIGDTAPVDGVCDATSRSPATIQFSPEIARGRQGGGPRKPFLRLR